MGKNNMLLIFLLCCTTGVQVQAFIKKQLNQPRPGDCIIKQRVEYKDPGRGGKDVVWDFGQLNVLDECYPVWYGAPSFRQVYNSVVLGDTFSIKEESPFLLGREHNTKYVYQVFDSALVLHGYENNHDRMRHFGGLPVLLYPMAYGDSISCELRSEDVYSQQLVLNIHGNYTLKVDASGILVLPSGDTLPQVLRTRSVHTILGDERRSMDSIYVDTRIETCKWYARGYRYPVFETLRTVHKKDSMESVFETAFFVFPSQEYGLEPDTANITERIRMEMETTVDTDLWRGMYYNFSPNPMLDYLKFELYLPKSVSNLQIQISDQKGSIFFNGQYGAHSEGMHMFMIDTTCLPPGYCVLDFWLDGYLVHGNVLLKQ